MCEIEVSAKSYIHDSASAHSTLYRICLFFKIIQRDCMQCVHCKIYDVKLQKTVIIQTALGVVDIMKHRNFT